MIKVNLLKSKGGSGTAVADQGTQIDFTNIGSVESSADGAKASSAQTLLKFIIILSLPLIVYAYESYNISQLNAQLRSIQQRSNDLQAEITRNEPVIARATQMQAEIKQIEERISVLTNLSKVRLREIKAIDFLQNSIPDRVWFQSLEFTRDSQFRVNGFATTDDALNQFIEAIKDKSFFRNVTLVNSEPVRNRTGVIKKFVITSDLIELDE